MDWIPTHVPYRQTGYFSRIITDYLSKAEDLSSFYTHPVSMEGMRASIDARRSFPSDTRKILVEALEEQYKDLPSSTSVSDNIRALGQTNTFTVCTAHQPALFTGHLYFIYKILHTIRLSETLRKQFPELVFVPIFYMGSEDADLDELGHIYLNNEKLVWDTKQKGAVGRMTTKGLDKLLLRIDGELSVQPHGKELIAILKECYLDSSNIQTATFRLIHQLFAEFGLIVLIADTPALKRLIVPVFEEDLFHQKPTQIVNSTISRLSTQYKVQANPRPINLFYLKDDLRGRIERADGGFLVHESSLRFSDTEMRTELQQHPDRFSPNVILRGLFQETILPNIAFIGGGGETAYWLELKELFEYYTTPFPVLVLRNSFLLVQRHWATKMSRLGLTVSDLFRPAEELLNELVKRESTQQLSLSGAITEATRYYDNLKALARPVDPTLVQHVEALQSRALDPVLKLEKKLLKAEKRKFGDQQRQVYALKAALFPAGGLQERVDNFLPWYAARGAAFIRELYEQSEAISQRFVVLTES